MCLHVVCVSSYSQKLTNTICSLSEMIFPSFFWKSEHHSVCSVIFWPLKNAVDDPHVRVLHECFVIVECVCVRVLFSCWSPSLVLSGAHIPLSCGPPHLHYAQLLNKALFVLSHTHSLCLSPVESACGHSWLTSIVLKSLSPDYVYMSIVRVWRLIGLDRELHWGEEINQKQWWDQRAVNEFACGTNSSLSCGFVRCI